MTQDFLRLSAELPLCSIDAKTQRFQCVSRAGTFHTIRTVFPLGKTWQHWLFQNWEGGDLEAPASPAPWLQAIYSLQGQALLGTCQGPPRHGPPTAALLREWPEGERPRVGRTESCTSPGSGPGPSLGSQFRVPVPGPNSGPCPSLCPAFFETLA